MLSCDRELAWDFRLGEETPHVGYLFFILITLMPTKKKDSAIDIGE